MEAERKRRNFELQECLNESEGDKRRKIDCCEYIERYTEYACVAGCLRNIESFIQRQQLL